MTKKKPAVTQSHTSNEDDDISPAAEALADALVTAHDAVARQWKMILNTHDVLDSAMFYTRLAIHQATEGDAEVRRELAKQFGEELLAQIDMLPDPNTLSRPNPVGSTSRH